MEPFATNLRKRAALLGISNAEVARRAGLTERRYGNYVTGQREPDFATLVRIATVLQSSPNDLIGFDAAVPPESELLGRLTAAASLMSPRDLELVVVQAEAIVATLARTEQ